MIQQRTQAIENTIPHLRYTTSVRRSQGFTLVEVLIAIAIFAILSVLAYDGLNSVMQTKEHTEMELDRLKQLQIAISKLQRDIEQTSPRDGTDELGGQLYKMSSSADTDTLIQLTRNGWPNPANLTRSHLQRVAYKFSDEKLTRITWPYVDRAQDSQATETELMDNLAEVQFRFFAEQEWHNDWPPNTLASGESIKVPVAVEVTLKMNDWGSIIRIFKVVQTQ